MTTLADFGNAAWLREPGVRAIFDCLEGAAGRTRVVGGAVRNAILGVPVGDVDFATDLRPADVMALATAAGHKVVPTGVDHGTVTVVVGEVAYEVTTLRVDAETDGRHATVAFSNDWHGDAARRDFTMNALYVDGGGVLFDPIGGLDDVRVGRVRFIGDPKTRIREDYLRILRFFRMQAWYGAGPVDAAGLLAAGAERAGLARVSAERIGQEMMRLLNAPAPKTAVHAMETSGVLAAVIDGDVDLDAFGRLLAIEEALALTPDAVLRLGILAKGRDLRDPLRLSNKDAARVAALADAQLARDEHAVRAEIVDRGAQTFRDRFIAAWAGSDRAVDDAATTRLFDAARTFDPPQFPLSGKDALASGIPEGPKTGAALAVARRAWIDSDFCADRDTLVAAMADWWEGQAG